MGWVGVTDTCWLVAGRQPLEGSPADARVAAVHRRVTGRVRRCGVHLCSCVGAIWGPRVWCWCPQLGRTVTTGQPTLLHPSFRYCCLDHAWLLFLVKKNCNKISLNNKKYELLLVVTLKFFD